MHTDLPGHTDEVYCVDFVADKIVSGGRDATVKMYVVLHLALGSHLCTLFGRTLLCSSVADIALSSNVDGKTRDRMTGSVPYLLIGVGYYANYIPIFLVEDDDCVECPKLSFTRIVACSL